MELKHPRLSQVLRFLRPGAKPGMDKDFPPGANFVCEDNGQGPSLKSWYMDETPPTQVEVDAVTNEQLDAWKANEH